MNEKPSKQVKRKVIITFVVILVAFLVVASGRHAFKKWRSDQAVAEAKIEKEEKQQLAEEAKRRAKEQARKKLTEKAGELVEAWFHYLEDKEGYTPDPVPLDPWNNQLKIELPENDPPRIVSAGPDGEFDSDDDIVASASKPKKEGIVKRAVRKLKFWD